MKRQDSLTAFMTIICLCALIAWSFAQNVQDTDSDSTSVKNSDESGGKTAFLNSKCNLCHSVESEKVEKTTGGFQKSKDKNVPPDLSAIGKKHNAGWITKYLKKTEALDGVKHVRLYRGTNEDLEAIAKWLEGLK